MANDARRAHVELMYNSLPFTPKILSWEYTDNLSGQADDLSIAVEDVQSLWISNYAPKKGSVLKAVRADDWNGLIRKKDLGIFEVDMYEVTSSPSQVKIDAISVPESSSMREEGRHKVWEKSTLKKVVLDIAKRHKMKLVFDVYDNPDYDRLEQNGESDIRFLMDVCNREGLALKVTGGSIVIFDEYVYEKASATFTIKKGDKNIKDYKAKTSFFEVYRACKVTYNSTKSSKPISHTYIPPNAPKVGKTLVVNEQVKNKTEAERIAKKRLRNENKNEYTMSFILSGPSDHAASMVGNIKGFGNFDGKYIITQVKARGGDGTETRIEMRRCLEGY